MNQFDITENDVWPKVVNLTGNITEETFESDIYALLSETADIDHFAVHVFNEKQLKDHRLLLIGGLVSEHWAHFASKRVDDYMRKNDRMFDNNLELLVQGKLDPDGLYHFRPDAQNQPDIASIYKDSGIGEKVYVLRVTQGKIYQLNLFRNVNKGPFSRVESKRLERMLPLVMNLLLVHFQICGVDEWQKHNEKHVISFLKDRGNEFFASLTKRETEVCDLIIYGQTTDGIAAEMELSVSSVKTYRNRAYKKLKIYSKSELFAMIINSQLYNRPNTISGKTEENNHATR